MIIGNFQSADDGFAGQIRTLLLDAMIAIVPAQPSDTENAPAWRVLLVEADNGIEIGAGWERRSERAGSYVALQIDDPVLGAPIRANLLRSAQNEDEYHLLWSRPMPRDKA
ncbi:uncharacterized protein (DUF736 family) [Sphingopyxis sp. OAS728]|uniref:DUF736 domain-containing protein n=1 Tax=Sphingopyxis sp. OAS728 TaxID=2663823 RepID=UPI00178B1712|nr:DUF736 domain-containing protein [Sphingopyxis sp. OAS728]MBE1529840.1 uncharacterized protein (DUF736 family) [Sphingopyxis sp. OAS728]